MYFTLKLIRFFVGLCIKALLFPFKLVTGLVRAANSAGSNGSIESIEPSASPSSNDVATTGNSSVDTTTSDVTPTKTTADLGDDGTNESPDGPESGDGGECTSGDPAGEGGDEVAEDQSVADPNSDSEGTEDDVQPAADADDMGTSDETVSGGQTDEPSQHTDDSVVATYQDELADDDPTVRSEAVSELADAVAADPVPDQATIDALADRLDDEAAMVRATACEAFGRIGAADAKPRLRDRRIDPDAEVSRAASRALRELEQR